MEKATTKEQLSGGWKADENKPRPDLLPWDVVRMVPGFTRDNAVEVLGEETHKVLGVAIDTLTEWFHGRFASSPADETRTLFGLFIRVLTLLGEERGAELKGEEGMTGEQHIALALMEVSKVLAFGANKYAPRNWEKGIKFSRLYAAALRHGIAHLSGETHDPETNLPHLAHMACCLVFVLAFINRGMASAWDDRVEAQKL